MEKNVKANFTSICARMCHKVRAELNRELLGGFPQITMGFTLDFEKSKPLFFYSAKFHF